MCEGPAADSVGTFEADPTSVVNTADRFWQLEWLHNHWSRPGGSRSWQWYLTFEDCPRLHALARRCQAAVASPYYDLIPPDGLHLTLCRIAAVDELTAEQATEVSAVATRACAALAPFDISIGRLGGTSGALGFAVDSSEQLRQLRDILHEATRSAVPDLRPPESEFEPHVSIAYCNSDGVPAAPVIAAVKNLQTLPPVTTTVREALIVLLERRERAYVWRSVARTPLPA